MRPPPHVPRAAYPTTASSATSAAPRPVRPPRCGRQGRLRPDRGLLRQASGELTMCTYSTARAAISGSAKGPDGAWFGVTDATVYFDHPVHAMAEHTLNIDFAAPSQG